MCPPIERAHTQVAPTGVVIINLYDGNLVLEAVGALLLPGSGVPEGAADSCGHEPAAPNPFPKPMG